jgi:hypothetical protein
MDEFFTQRSLHAVTRLRTCWKILAVPEQSRELENRT